MWLRLFVVLIAVMPAWGAAPASHTRPLHFRIKLAPQASAAPVSGRMLVFMSGSPEDRDALSAGFFPGATWVAGIECQSIAPGQVVEFDPSLSAYPQPFSQAKPGVYRFMALLDQDHSYPYSGRDADDLYSAVVKVEGLNPANATPVELTLSKHSEPAKLPRADNVKLVEYESPSLSAFWGRPVKMRAAVVLPPSYAKGPERRYPAVYVNHGFGGGYRDAFYEGRRMLRPMESGKAVEMVLVFLDGSLPSGDHEFADSVNNGPWGRALTEEFIPYLEHEFRLIGRPSARFLTGHSSGGWASLWLQVTYPDFFGGTWSTAPDPVDFRSFCGINATPGSMDNAYTDANGKPRNLARDNGKDIASWEQWARQEQALGPYGGQLASFEWVFSPRGPGGRPLQLFNRATGQLNPETLGAWRKYDIRLILEQNWDWLGPKLKGKLNIICGGDDTFHLEEPVKMMCGFLSAKGSDAVCEIVPGRDHMDLYYPYKTYPDGLTARIEKEMGAKFEAANR